MGGEEKLEKNVGGEGSGLSLAEGSPHGEKSGLTPRLLSWETEQMDGDDIKYRKSRFGG